LSRINLALHLFHRQWEAGRKPEAEATLARVFSGLETLDREWTATKEGIVRREPPVPAPVAAKPVCRVLIVEDDDNERELLAGLLSMNGCECPTAADGEEALRYLQTNDLPDFVLLDMWMPRCDGPRTIRAIRGDGRLDGLKVFSVSGTPPHSVGVPTGHGGIDAWFPKPLNPKALWNAMRESLAAPHSN